MSNDYYDDNSILGGCKMCWCVLPAITGSTDCCKNCSNRGSSFKITTDIDLDTISPCPTSEFIMYVLPQNILSFFELVGDTYNIVIYRIKVLERRKYLVVGLTIKEANDRLKDAQVNINFFEN